MAASNVTPANTLRHSIIAELGSFGARAMARAGTFLRKVQAAKMKSTLSRLSDYQLKQMDISRKEIAEYADNLSLKG